MILNLTVYDFFLQCMLFWYVWKEGTISYTMVPNKQDF